MVYTEEGSYGIVQEVRSLGRNSYFEWVGYYSGPTEARNFSLSEMPKHVWPLLTRRDVYTKGPMIERSRLEQLLDEWVVQYG